MNNLSLDIALIFIPGLICTKLYMTLTSFRRPGYVEYAGYSLVFGFASYVALAILIKLIFWDKCSWCINAPEFVLPYVVGPSPVTRLISVNNSIRSSDIVGASAFAFVIALALSWFKRKRSFFKFTAWIGASYRYSTDSVFVTFSTLAQNQYVRIWKKDNLAYEGTIHLFYEYEDMYEVVLANVEILSLDESNSAQSKETNPPVVETSLQEGVASVNPIAYLYVRWNKTDDVLIEQPVENEQVTQEQQFCFARAKDYFHPSPARPAESAGTSGLGSSAPPPAADAPPGPEGEA